MIDSTSPSGTPPNVIDVYRTGWDLLLARARELLPIGVVWAVVSLPAAVFGENVLTFAYSTLVVGPVNFGGSYALLRAARGESTEISHLFLPFRIDYVQSVLGSLLVSISVMVGFMLLIVPGVLAIVRLSWVPYLVVEGRRPAIDAIQESWIRTGPYAWPILGISLLVIPLTLVGLFFFIVGVIPALILAHLAAATFYVAVVPREEVTAPSPTSLA